MRVSELPCPFTDYGAQENRPCTLTGQHSAAGSGGVVGWTEGMTTGKLMAALDGLARAVLESLQWCEQEKAAALTSSDQLCDDPPPQICIICCPLGFMIGPDLLIQSCRISLTTG